MSRLIASAVKKTKKRENIEEKECENALRFFFVGCALLHDKEYCADDCHDSKPNNCGGVHT
jgi:hypothetical protein